MKRKIAIKETGLATGFIIVAVYIISLIPLNFELINPISNAFKDFSITDIYYSHIKESPPLNDDIVLVNIGNLPREGIAELVQIINEDQPKVIGIDAFFEKLKPKNPEGDSVLASALSKVKNLVLVSELIEDEEGEKVIGIRYSHPVFMQNAKAGFADMLTTEDHLQVVRNCLPKQEFEGKTYRSFATELVHAFDPVLAEKFLARNNEIEEINYQGNLNFNKEATKNSKNVFHALDWYQVMDRMFEPGEFKGKIVIMGFMGADFEEVTIVDKFFTPLNKNYIGKASHDMYGVIVHANIVGMILKGKLINTMPEWLDYLLSIIFIFLNVWLFAWMYYNLEEWFDGASILVTLVEVLVLMGIQIFVFALWDYKEDITLPIVALLLMGNMVEIYFGIIQPGGSRVLRRKRIFTEV